jgi:hypothetical protein
LYLAGQHIFTCDEREFSKKAGKANHRTNESLISLISRALIFNGTKNKAAGIAKRNEEVLGAASPKARM